MGNGVGQKERVGERLAGAANKRWRCTVEDACVGKGRKWGGGCPVTGGL